MKLKSGSIIVCTMFLVIIFSSMPLILAQEQIWETCQISAYGTEIEEDLEVKHFKFTTATPPSGSEIPNTIYIMDNDSGENYTVTLEAGDVVSVIYEDANVIEINVAPEQARYTIEFDGSVSFVSINSINIPEFPIIFIVPMFIAATLLALIYRRKRLSPCSRPALFCSQQTTHQ